MVKIKKRFEKAFEDFPMEMLPEPANKILKRYEDPDFGIGGIDAEHRLVSFSDDGWVVGYHLDGAETERTNYGYRLDTEQDSLADRQLGEEFMLGRDTSDWVWVHPRYRWLTEDSE